MILSDAVVISNTVGPLRKGNEDSVLNDVNTFFSMENFVNREVERM